MTQPLGWVNPRVGFDNYTFSPGVKASTIWVVLSLAIFNNWPLCQLDVKNVFLRGFLREKIYMEQLLVILVPNIPHMCRLRKELYGLKQAPRALFYCFSSFLIDVRFSFSQFIIICFLKSDNLIYLLLYVDDIVEISNNWILLDGFYHDPILGSMTIT